jgi:SecD/SecF fusion protein
LGAACVIRLDDGKLLGNYDYNGFAYIVKLGLDLKGGVYAVFQVDESKEEATDEAINGTIDNIQRTLMARGFTEAVVAREGSAGNWKIRVEVPDVADPETIFDMIGKPAYLEFKIPVDEDPNAEPYITGKNVVEAYAGYNGTDPVVFLKLDSDGAKKFSQATTDRKGKTIGIYLDGTAIASPTVNDVISNGTATITGVGDYAACEALALRIQSGAFTVSLQTIENRTISPTLGVNAIRNSVIAGAIGTILIIIMLIFLYRMFGVAASISLIAYVVFTIMVLGIFPWVQLTLSGIGGIILGIGMAVDANIVIFERIKDEYEKGKPIPASVNVGFKNAMRAIIDSNLTTILGALALLIFGPASLQSFSITLMISIVLSFFTALTLTRFVVKRFLVFDNKTAKKYNLKTEKDGFGKGRQFVEKFKKLKIAANYKRWFLIPAAVVALAIVMYAGFAIYNQDFAAGMNLGLDFTGGTALDVKLTNLTGVDFIDDATFDEHSGIIIKIVEDAGFKVSQVQKAEGNSIQVRYNNISSSGNDEAAKLKNDEIIENLFNYYSERYNSDDATGTVAKTDFTTEFRGASARSDLLLKALGAVAVALLATLLYIALRFKFRYGIAAVLAIIHNLILMVAATVIFRVPVNASFIAALVTIIGYSINDIIVIFDRVREKISLQDNKIKYDADAVADASIGDTVSRTFYTTVTTLITIIMLAILGGSSIQEFALPIIFGLVIGFYSSLFVAPSIWSLFSKDAMKRASEKKRPVDVSALSAEDRAALSGKLSSDDKAALSSDDKAALSSDDKAALYGKPSSNDKAALSGKLSSNDKAALSALSSKDGTVSSGKDAAPLIAAVAGEAAAVEKTNKPKPRYNYVKNYKKKKQ